MQFDLQTLFAITVFANGTAGILLLFSWLQHRNIPALAIWGVGFLLGTLATGLITARGHIPDFWSILVGNAVLALAYGSMWTGVRSFEGRPNSIPVLCAGVIIWVFACQFESFYHSSGSRVLLMALIINGYLVLSAWELWRSRERGLYSRWPVIVVLLLHAGAFFARISAVTAWARAPETFVFQFDWVALLGVEGLLFTFCVAYLLGSLAQERVALRHRRDAHIDPLTGIANRRAFFSRGEALVRRARFDRQSAALLLFDLDEFKQINDAHGHLVGDRVLRAFSQLATRTVRPNDLFGRIGGEEFACLLVDIGAAEAMGIAERVRDEFASWSLDLEPEPVHGTVSIGLASLGSGYQTLSELILAADQALYRAKAKGRNRIELSGAAPAADRRRTATG